MLSYATTSDIEELKPLVENFSIELTEELFLANPFSKYIIFRENKEMIGFLSYEDIYERFEIDYIFVVEEYRNKGIASNMLEFLLKEAKEKQIENITLEVAVENRKAISLYKKYGFEEAALRKQYYGNEDAYLLIRKM